MTNRRQQLRTAPELGLTQRLALTPSLLQKIELLTLSKLELEELLNQALVDNPLLEDYAEIEMQEAPEQTAEIAAGIEPRQEEKKERQKDRQDDMDFQAFFNDYLDVGFETRELEEVERPSFETFLVKPSSLSDHLRWQLGVSDASERIKEIAEHIIGNLDEGGYLLVPLEELCALASCSIEEAEEALKLVQGLDPLGVAARDLKECLLIQLRAKGGAGSLAEKIISDCLPLVQSHKYKDVAAKLGATMGEVKAAMETIKSLIPKPGERYNPSKTQYVQPEVFVSKVGDEYVIALNEDGLPLLRLNPQYREMLRSNSLSPEAKEYFKEKMRAAVDLLRSVHQRRQTIYRVCECIVKRQRDFLENGMQSLRPMLIKDVARELELHPSTISRVVTNKYIHTPQGVMELRKFFTSGVEKSDGQKLSIVQLKHKIKQIIENEDRNSPLSDEEIAKRLAEEGILINRRTVAKYREQMGIAGSRERKMTYLI